MRRRSVRILLASLAVALASAACTQSGDPAEGVLSHSDTAYDDLPGESATWELQQPDKITAESTELTIDVTRTACASGKTGEVLDPIARYEQDQIVIIARVAELADEVHDCQENDSVPVQITLAEPIGDRPLIDGECTEGKGADYLYCEEPVRWSPK